MSRTFAGFLCATFLLVSGIQGLVTSKRGRCLCQSKHPIPVPVKCLAKLDYHPKSPSCDQNEIIATLKPSGEMRCLDPESKAVKMMLRNYQRKMKLMQAKKKRVTGHQSLQWNKGLLISL